MTEETYSKLLERAMSQLPHEVTKGDRFVLPEPVSAIMGNRTVLHNLKEICDRLRRKSEHVMKYLSKELATAGHIDGARAVFQGKFDYTTIRRLIVRYSDEYVFCPICQQPDTRIIKEGRYRFLLCDACGARSSLRSNL
jgi:translation initiation factor 2 subunit 2